MAEKKKSLEQAFEEMDEIINKLENPEISLEDSFKEYQAGMKLLKECNKQIDQIEKKILVLNEDGETDEF